MGPRLQNQLKRNKEGECGEKDMQEAKESQETKRQGSASKKSTISKTKNVEASQPMRRVG